MTSTAHPIDIAIFAVFLVITLIVGLFYGRQVKTLKDFAMGGNNFSTVTLVATVVATYAAGSTLFVCIENTYTNGLYFLIALLGYPISMFLNGHLAMRMGEFMKSVSVAGAMKDLYGENVQLITAISGIIRGIGAVAVQFAVMAKMLEFLFNLEGSTAIYIAASIVIFYSSFGGVRAVAFTDVLQFFTFATIIPILALTVWNSIQDPTRVVSTVAANATFDIREVVGWTPRFISTLGLFLYYALPGFNPAKFQRIAMARDVKQAKNALIYAAGVLLLILMTIAWMAVLLLTENPDLEKAEVIPYLISSHVGVGLRGLLGVCVMALAMSTADSYLNASSVLFSSDVVKPLTKKKKGEVEKEGSVAIARLFSICMGLFALLLALYSKDILKLLLLSGSLNMPIATIPMLLPVLGFRTTSRSALMGMAAGLTTVVIWSYFGKNSDSIIPGMLANLIFLFATHYLLGEKGGWKKVEPDSPLGLERAARKRRWRRLCNAYKEFEITTYLVKILPAREGSFFLLGLYAIGSTYMVFYTIDTSQYATFITQLQYLTSFVIGSLLLYPIWGKAIKNKRIIAWYWPTTIGFLLFFVGMLLALIGHFHPNQLIVLFVNLLVATFLLPWAVALAVAFVWGILGQNVFIEHLGQPLPITEWSSLSTVHGFLMFAAFLLVLIKSREAYTKLVNKNSVLSSERQVLKQELFTYLQNRAAFFNIFQESGASGLIDMVREARKMEEYIVLSDMPRKTVFDFYTLQFKLTNMAFHLDKIAHRLAHQMALSPSLAKPAMLLFVTDERLLAREIDTTTIQYENLSKEKAIECDKEKIHALLVNSVLFLQAKLGEDIPITMALEDTNLRYDMPFVWVDYGKNVPALRLTITTERALPTLEKSYTSQVYELTTPAMPEKTEDVLLINNQRIVDAHYGYKDVAVIAEGRTLSYVIPLQLRQARGAEMDQPCMQLGPQIPRADETYPGAKQLELAFLEDVKKRGDVKFDRMLKAVDMIKVYHGDQKSRSGAPFYLHAIEVAHLTLDYYNDGDTLVGALLHNIVQKTPLSLDCIEAMFNKEVANIVAGTTGIEAGTHVFSQVELSPNEGLYKLCHLRDQGMLSIKLAESVVNMRTIEHALPEEQYEMAKRNLSFYIPAAALLKLPTAIESLKEKSEKIVEQYEKDKEASVQT